MVLRTTDEALLVSFIRQVPWRVGETVAKLSMMLGVRVRIITSSRNKAPTTVLFASHDSKVPLQLPKNIRIEDEAVKVYIDGAGIPAELPYVSEIKVRVGHIHLRSYRHKYLLPIGARITINKPRRLVEKLVKSSDLLIDDYIKYALSVPIVGEPVLLPEKFFLFDFRNETPYEVVVRPISILDSRVSRYLLKKTWCCCGDACFDEDTEG